MVYDEDYDVEVCSILRLTLLCQEPNSIAKSRICPWQGHDYLVSDVIVSYSESKGFPHYNLHLKLYQNTRFH